MTDTAAVDAKQGSERETILRAAFRLIGSPTGEGASVQEILAEAGLSTRAFYRQFPSKDDLILTMYRTASERHAAELHSVLAETDDPVVALQAWIRQQLAVVYEPRRARQTVVLTSAEVRAVVGFDEVDQRSGEIRRAMLASVIGSGKRSGAFSSATDPDEDARAVMSVVGGLIAARIAGRPTPTWDDATAHTTALFLRAFGVTGQGPS